jgi:DNA excision repair protein ERCC-4
VGRRMKPEIQFVLLIDSREPVTHPWDPYLSVETVRGTLQIRDITLVGCEEWIAIERKSLNDLVSCLCTGRERFTKELQRAARIPNFSVIIEASYRDILQGNYRSGMTPVSAWGAIIALQERHRIPFYFAGDMKTAERLRLSKRRLQDLCRTGQIGFVQVTPRMRAFTEEQIAEYVQQRTVVPPRRLVDRKSPDKLPFAPRGGDHRKSTGDSLSERKKMKEELRSWR